MRKVALILIFGLICSCLVLPALADSSIYTATPHAVAQTVKIGEDVSIVLDVDSRTDTTFAAAEVVLRYDSTKLSFTSVEGIDFNMVSTESEGILQLESYGINKNTGKNVCTFHFTALEQGESEVQVSQAAFSNRKDAATKDLTSATILEKSVSITVVPPDTQPVIILNLTDINIDGDDYTPTGENYTFRFSGNEFYQYSFLAMMAGKEVDVVANGDGTYTVYNVTDTLSITIEQTPVTFKISFEGNKKAELPEDDMATYGEDYSFTIPAREGYDTELVSICYSDGTEVPYSLRKSTVTIQGENIVDDIIVTLQQTAISDGGEETSKTGDSAMPVVWCAVFMLCVIMLPVVKRCRRKES